MTRTNLLNQLHWIQQKTLQPQVHPQRLRDHQVVTLDPKRSSNLPPMSMDNQNAILHQWTHQNAIQLKSRSTQWKLHLSIIPLCNV